MICNQANSSTLQCPTRSVKKISVKEQIFSKRKVYPDVINFSLVWSYNRFEQSFVDYKLLHV